MVDLSVQIEIDGGLTWARWKRIVPPADLAGRVRHLAAQYPGESPEALLAGVLQRSPSVIAGSPDHVIERIHAYAAVGVQEIIIQRYDIDDDEGLQIIAEEVLPHVK